MSPAVLFSLASLTVSVIAFVSLRAWVKKRTGAERILSEFRDEVNALIAELNQVTVRDGELVEARVKKLRGLLEDADRRIETFGRRITVFDRETARRGVEDAVYLSPDLFRQGPDRATPVTAPPVMATPVTAMPPPETAVPEPADRVAESGQEPAAGAAPQGEPSGALPLIRLASRQIPPKPLPFAEQVIRLHREGLSSGLIASRLGVTVTEVDLAITIASRNAADR